MTVFRYLILITIDFSDFMSPFSPQFSFRLRRYIKHSRQCLTTFPSISKFVKNTPLSVAYLTLFSVFRNVVKHGLSCLIYRLNWFWIIAACYLKSVYNYKRCTSSTLNLFHLFYQSFCVALSLWPESQSLYCSSESHSSQYHHRNLLQQISS